MSQLIQISNCFFLSMSNIAACANAVSDDLSDDVAFSHDGSEDQQALFYVQSFLNENGWSTTGHPTNEMGDAGIVNIQYDNDRGSDGGEKDALEVIAPFVKKGSTIDMQDDGDLFRLVFNGKELIEDTPEIVWRDPMSF